MVLTRLRKAGVTLNLEKCIWFSDAVEYLGHIVRPGQLHVHNKNFEALKHASFPTTNTQQKTFLVTCNVYRHFVKDFAKRAKPLNAMTRADILPDLTKPFDVALAASDDICQALLAPPILASPKSKGQMIVDVDACVDQFGCTLLQEQHDGTRLPVGYWSHGLSPAWRKYATTERECLGVVWSVLKLRHFLDGHRCLISTDHPALSRIYSTSDSSGRLMRSSSVPPSRFFVYFQAIWGRHSVVTHRNRSLRLGIAGRGSGDTIIRFGWHVPLLRQRESSSHGQVPGLCITVMMQFHEFRRGPAPGALRRDHCQHGMVRKAADRPRRPRSIWTPGLVRIAGYLATQIDS